MTIPDSIARPVLELLGRDHNISWLYCGGARITARHPAGQMYAHGGVLPDIYSAYITRVQLNYLVAQAAVRATAFFANWLLPASTGDLAGHPVSPPLYRR